MIPAAERDQVHT